MAENIYHITDELLVKYLLREVSLDEKMKVEAWIKADASNEKYFQQFEFIWKESKRLAAVSPVDESAAWQRFQKRANAHQEKPVQRIPRFTWMRIAALFVLIAWAALFAYLFFPQKPIETLVVQSATTVIADTLPDGSVVTLNKNSVLRYPEKFTDTARLVVLEGEAFFNVTPNKEKPFIIRVNDVQIRVLGTSFNVKTNNGNTEVIVETGAVQVIKASSVITLQKGEKLNVQQGDTVLQKAKIEDELHNYYRSKAFVCMETPLWKLVDVLNEAYNANIIIENKTLRSLPLTTTFYNYQSLDEILDIVSDTFSITIEKREDRIILK